MDRVHNVTFLGVQWLCTIVDRVHNAMLVVHNGRAPLCTGCTMLYSCGAQWLCTCAPGAQCCVGSAQWSCTIMHSVNKAILVVHNGRAPFCTG